VISYFEVFLRWEIPNPFAGDIVLVLHIVPMMAAMAMQPDRQHDKYAARLGLLDLLLLLVWWLYLFLFFVIPWHYIHPSEALYGRSFNVLSFQNTSSFCFLPRGHGTAAVEPGNRSMHVSLELARYTRLAPSPQCGHRSSSLLYGQLL